MNPFLNIAVPLGLFFLTTPVGGCFTFGEIIYRYAFEKIQKARFRMKGPPANDKKQRI
jgi:hypothetical protein